MKILRNQQCLLDNIQNTNCTPIMQRENDRGIPSHWWFENSLVGGSKSAAKRATKMEGSGSATGKWFCDGDGVLRRRWGSTTEIRGLKRDVVYQKKKKEGCKLGLQKECGGNSTGEGEKGKERALVESQRKRRRWCTNLIVLANCTSRS
jgi:hypothetical protein